jgi:hypothetical protein
MGDSELRHPEAWAQGSRVWRGRAESGGGDVQGLVWGLGELGHRSDGLGGQNG